MTPPRKSPTSALPSQSELPLLLLQALSIPLYLLGCDNQLNAKFLTTLARDVIFKLLGFSAAMIIVPIGSYFATVHTVFNGKILPTYAIYGCKLA